ncbi:hypothetical protein LTR95_008354 [Oleoguttula sp. CCFEE 5521]
MADPLTAIGSAAAILQLTEEAAKLGIYLCRLYKDTKHVDKTVDQLGVEVVTLGETWTAVHVQVEDIIKATSGKNSASISVYDSNGQLWRCICDQVQHCWSTLRELQAIISDIGVAHGNIYTQVKRQIKVDGSKEAIGGIRQRIGLHMSSIQVILQLINIKISHLAPGQASNELLNKINALETLIQSLGREGAFATDRVAAATQLDGAASLIACAEEVIHSGASLWNASVADGSLYGGFHRPERTQWTTSWLQVKGTIQTPDIAEFPEDISPPASGSSRSQVDLLQSGDTSLTSGVPSNSDAQEASDDDEDYTEHAMLKLGLQEGRQAVQDMQWSDADEYLKESLSLLSRLPAQSRAAYDVIELQYLLAVCAFHREEENSEVTREALTSLMERMPINDKQRLVVCDARFLLARLYIRTGHLELARSSCQSASEGRRRVLGNRHEAYYGALALLARIYQMLKNPRRAHFAEMMMAEETQRISALGGIDEILASDSMLKFKTSIPPVEVQIDGRSMNHVETQSSSQSAHETSDDPPKKLDDEFSRLPESRAPGARRTDDLADSSSPRGERLGPPRTLSDTAAAHLNQGGSQHSENKLTRYHTVPAFDANAVRSNHARESSLASHAQPGSIKERSVASTKSDISTSPERKKTVSPLYTAPLRGVDDYFGLREVNYHFKPDPRESTSKAAVSTSRKPPSGELPASSPGSRLSTVRDSRMSPDTGLEDLSQASAPSRHAAPRLDLEWQNVKTIKAHREFVTSIAFSPDGTLVASASRDKTCAIRDTSTGDVVHTLRDSLQFRCCAFSPHESLLALGYNNTTVSLWATGTQGRWRQSSTIRHPIKEDGYSLVLTAVAFMPDGRRLVTACMDKTIRLWDIESRALLKEMRGHVDDILDVAVSPDGQTIASGSRDMTVGIWHTKTGAAIMRGQGHTSFVNSVAFSPNGIFLVSGSSDTTIKAWKAKGLEGLATLQGHSGAVQAVAFSPDGWTLASASEDGTVRLWDVATWTEISILDGGGKNCTSTAFSPDG